MLQRFMRLLGLGRPSQKVHDIKNQYTSENLQVQMKTRQLQHGIEENDRRLRELTAFKVAIAAGRIK